MASLLGRKMEGLGWIKLTKKIFTNMIFFDFTKDVNIIELQLFMRRNGVAMKFVPRKRFVLHLHIREKEVDKIISLFEQFDEEVQKK